jgi:hypothetical protein|tara:strand:- start:1779 stop:2390 length:612 start_codon:yes stop_codon:yes gene_type:complete
MSTKQKIQNIKTNIERTIQGLRTQPREFKYQQTGGFVSSNLLYSIYYTLSKDEIYLTGIINTSNSKIIEKVNDKTLFRKYKDVKLLSRTPYPKTTPAKPTETDYEIGEITRYFTQIGNDKSKPIFEISAKTFDTQNTLYKYTDFQWKISGTKEEVIRENQITIDLLEKDYPGISSKLFPLQLWKPTIGTFDDIQKKLSLLKKT